MSTATRRPIAEVSILPKVTREVVERDDQGRLSAVVKTVEQYADFREPPPAPPTPGTVTIADTPENLRRWSARLLESAQDLASGSENTDYVVNELLGVAIFAATLAKTIDGDDTHTDPEGRDIPGPDGVKIEQLVESRNPAALRCGVARIMSQLSDLDSTLASSNLGPAAIRESALGLRRLEGRLKRLCHAVDFATPT